MLSLKSYIQVLIIKDHYDGKEDEKEKEREEFTVFPSLLCFHC
jgi:hypothetical protein